MDSLTISYDWTWKQNVQLEQDTNKQFILVNETSDDSEESQNLEEAEDNYMLVNGEIQYLDLKYLDEPGLQLYLTQEPELSQLIYWFQPLEMFAAFTENLNSHLLSVIEKDFKNTPQQLQQVYNKKKFKENELQQWLGLHIWFGIFRFPQISDYWHSEQWLKGGIEICMQEGRFKFIDTHFLEYEQRAYPLAAVQEIKKKFKKVYRPDQEMVIVKNNRTLYLFDCETLFIIDQTVMIQNDSDEKSLIDLAAAHSNKNHIIYFDRHLLTGKIVKILLNKKIYPVGYVSDEDNSLKVGLYCSQNEFMEKLPNGELFYYPKVQLDEIKKKYDEEIEKANKRVTFIELYQSRFYQNQLAKEEVGNINQLRVMFEEYFEGCIYNLFSFYHSILIPKEDYSYKKFRLEVAKVLVGEKLEQLEKDRMEIKRRSTMKLCERSMQSEKLSFGLMQSYDCEQFHCPYFQPNHEQIKYCFVCMKFDGLSKPYFRCLVCEKYFAQGKIFLCVFPCFELFHRNPSEFIFCELGTVQNLGEDKYFKKNDTLPDAASLMKPPPPTAAKPQVSNSRRAGQNGTGQNSRSSNRAQSYHNYNWSYHRYEKARYDLDKSEKDLDQYLEGLGPSEIEHLYRNMPVHNQSQERASQQNTCGLSEQTASIQRQTLQAEQVQQIGSGNEQLANLSQKSLQQLPVQQAPKQTQNGQQPAVAGSRPHQFQQIPQIPQQTQSYKVAKDSKLNDKLFADLDEKEFQMKPTAPKQSNYQQMRQQQAIEEQKSPFEKFMDQVKKKKNPAKQEEQQ